MNEEGKAPREPRPGDVVIRPAPAVINLREELPKIVSQLSTEQLRELVGNLRRGYLGKIPIGAEYGEELAKLIEPTAPELARQLRIVLLESPQAFRDWITIWLAVLGVILGAIELNDDPPPPSNQIIFNIAPEETTIILPTPPPAPPPAAAEAPKPTP